MSDRSSDPSADDSSESAGDGDFEPGGGPQRVVSEESVDDILDSLADSNSESSGPAATVSAETDAPSERERTAARDDPDAERDLAGKEQSTAGDPGSAGATGGDESTDEPNASTTTDESDDSTGADESIDPETNSAVDAAEPSPTVDDAAASLPDEASEESLEELAARVEQGTVTGADVRAAEAGDGRDETPGIDEIELSVDDLERPDATIGSDPASDDGPLAGSIDPSGAAGDGSSTSESADDSSDGSSPGLLGRLVGLFSR